jgi:diamine N-acetyltransferase
MSASTSEQGKTHVTLRPVGSDNWRDVAKLKVTEEQRDFVSEPCRYLALCAYGKDWQPLAITLGEQVIGFLMWCVDPADGSCWLGGFLVDHDYQGRGYGRQALQTALAMLAEEHGYQHFALSYNPANTVAKHLYRSMGFTETGEWEDDEVVARLSLEAKTATPIFLLVGGPAVGKSSTARALAAQFAKSIHIPVDTVRTLVVSGVVHPGAEWSGDLVEQLALARESVAHMALAYNEAGFIVVIDDFWDPNSQLLDYGLLLSHPQIHKVLLYPTQDAAHARNLARSGPGPARTYLDDGIRATYAHLRTVVADLETRGWLVLDTTHLGIAETVSSLIEQAT